MSHKKETFNIWRIIAVSALLCAIMSFMLYLRGFFVEELFLKLDELGSMENLKWVLKYGSALVPSIVFAIALSCVYGEKQSSAVFHKEQLIALIVLAIFTYICLVPYAMNKMLIDLEEEAEEIKTLFDAVAVWLVVQAIPMLIMIAYHGSRAEALDGKAENKETLNEGKTNEA